MMNEAHPPIDRPLTDRPEPLTADDRRRQAVQKAIEIFESRPDWVTFFRKILGVDGVVRRTFPKDELDGFEETEEYDRIQQMVAKLREQPQPASDNNEPTRVITVRLPKSLHELLRTEAHEKQTSMNQLCISKLLQLIDNELVPSD
jgi:predicted HicB family RNase H-like nuclease